MSGMTVQPRSGLEEPDWRFAADDYITALAWSPDGATLAAASAAGPVQLLDGVSGALRHRLPGHTMGTLALAWSGDGRRLASAGQDGKARLWDPIGGSAMAELDGGSSWVEQLAWSPRSDRLATGAGKWLKLWQADGSPLQACGDHASTLTGLAWLKDGRSVATACYGGLSFWRVGQETVERSFPWKGSFVSLALSRDGRHAAAGCQDASMLVWDLKTAKNVGMSGYPGKITLLDWDRKSRFLATNSGDQAVLWDFSGDGPAQRDPLVLEQHRQRITDLSFHPQRDRLASIGEDGLLCLWRLPDGELVDLYVLKSRLSKLSWNPRSGALAIGSAEGEVVLIRIE